MKRDLRHDARFDTMWIGKGAKSPWLVVVGIVALAYMAVRVLSG